MWEDEDKSLGLVAAARWTAALGWETIEEHHFTLLAEAPGSLRSRCFRYIEREDEDKPLGLVGTTRCTDALVWETVEEHHFTLLAKAPGSLFWHFRSFFL